MQCPKCGNTDLLPKFKCCPECGSPLPHAQNIPREIEHDEHGVETTPLQQSASSTRHNGDLGLNSRSIQGKFNINLLGFYYSWLLRIQYLINSSQMRFDLISLISLKRA